MRKKNFTSMGMACLLGCCLMLGSCSSEVDNLDIRENRSGTGGRFSNKSRG